MFNNHAVYDVLYWRVHCCLPEGKAANPGHIKAEGAEQRAEVVPSEDKPELPEAHTNLPDKPDGECDVSAMEVEWE